MMIKMLRQYTQVLFLFRLLLFFCASYLCIIEASCIIEFFHIASSFFLTRYLHFLFCWIGIKDPFICAINVCIAALTCLHYVPIKRYRIFLCYCMYLFPFIIFEFYFITEVDLNKQLFKVIRMKYNYLCNYNLGKAIDDVSWWKYTP